MSFDILGDSVTAINIYAFKACTSLANIIGGRNVTSIHEYAFDNAFGSVNPLYLDVNASDSLKNFDWSAHALNPIDVVLKDFSSSGSSSSSRNNRTRFGYWGILRNDSESALFMNGIMKYSMDPRSNPTD